MNQHNKIRSRREAVIINKLRLGHCRLTHSYLMSGDDQPVCESCRLPLTVKHILVDCPNILVRLCCSNRRKKKKKERLDDVREAKWEYEDEQSTGISDNTIDEEVVMYK